MSRQIVLEDPRPFSDPEHPIWQAPQPVAKAHPDDYALPTLQSITVDGVTIRQVDDWIIESCGVLMSIDMIKQALTNPPTDCLFAFRRVGCAIQVTRIGNANSANDFFRALDKPEG